MSFKLPVDSIINQAKQILKPRSEKDKKEEKEKEDKGTNQIVVEDHLKDDLHKLNNYLVRRRKRKRRIKTSFSKIYKLIL